MRQQVELQRVGAVGQRSLRRVVDFDENAAHAHGNRGARQRLDELRLPAGDRAGAARQLHTVRGIKHYRPPRIAHDLEPAHVHHQVVVAERGSALGDDHLGIARGGHFFRGAVNIVRRHELSLLDVDDAAGATRGQQQIGLPAQEGGYLQNVGDRSRRFGLRRFMDIGEDRKAFRLEPGQYTKAFDETWPAICVQAGAVGLVKRRLEDEAAAHGVADAVRHAVDVLFAFDHARPGDQHQRTGRPLGPAECAELKGHGSMSSRPAPSRRPAGAADGIRRRRR